MTKRVPPITPRQEREARAAIAAVMERFPYLTAEGLARPFDTHLPKAEREEQFRLDRNALLSQAAEFRAACTWLGRQRKRKTINRRGTSYGLKHVCEDEVGYMTNGTFIAAAIACGFDIQETHDGSPNAWLNIGRLLISNFNL
jgi:hypothetical protein